MNADEIQSRLLLFVAVVGVVVVGVAGAGVITDQGTTERPTVDHAHLQPDGIETSELERGGEIDFDSPAGPQTVAIDAAHANDVSKADLQPVVSALTAEGHSVEYVEYDQNMPPEERAEHLADALENVDAFVVVEPQARYTTGETEVVSDFAASDGRLLFAAGPDTGGDMLGGLLGLPAADTGGDGEFASVSSQFGIAYDTGYLYDMESEHNYRTLEVTPEAGGQLTDGVDRVVFDGPTQVSTSGQTLLATSETTEHSESREAGSHSVAVEGDNAVAVGDAGFMTSERYNVADNEVFIGNVLEFLVSGTGTPGGLDAPADSDSSSGAAGEPPALPEDTADLPDDPEEIPEDDTPDSANSSE
ncbi:hypothetical protein [Natrarchaeobaculum sulfurireducens]|uniref:Uncharacterized protein n=1 Tax=Natrarchaeobaculum sulfurireducens TaxID=2044521 RepID=A0A346PUN9_9EURY|nr:hypothetical protein [Natrarchaeobaculum sulfurireducens]AXR79465.1 hypothetical protein AArc1_3159 [Natrarchaeobaculum sulfurireducens]AXR83234.1 hypothetical protein AArcMg_3249 [Natrarchaeobaculum sulfurireducens]